MKARNPLLIYNVGNVVVLLDGKVTEVSVNNTAASTGCHISFYSLSCFLSQTKRD